jgi:signal transduction histidine kinase
MISQAVRLIQEAPERRDISIEYQFESVLPKVLVDPIQIQEVFINLISNAVEANGGRFQQSAFADSRFGVLTTMKCSRK